MVRLFRRSRLGSDDSGQLTVLVLGFSAIAALLAIVGIVTSTLFLDRRALAAAAGDSVDTGAIYGQGLQCGQPLPLDQSGATTAAAVSVANERDLRNAFSRVDAPRTAVAGPTVTVVLTGQAKVPFGSVIALLDPSVRDGFTITVRSSAQSPTVVPGGC